MPAPVVFMDPVESSAQDAVVRRHREGVWRYLRALGAGPDLADDLTQETFLEAWRAGFEDRGERAAGRFLRSTARHLWLRRCRAEGRRREEAVAEALDGIWEREVGNDTEAFLDALRRCLDELEARPRQAVRLRYRERLDRGAMAAVLGMKENGVKTLLQRTRAALRECIRRRST